jgi:muramidase (phage lysozyme)
LAIGQILRWIEDKPGQYHAIGRYQIISDTLAYLIEAESISHGAVSDKRPQDQLAIRLLMDAGLGKYEAGTLSIEQFMDRVAGVWAGLPLQNDKSAYDGIAGNRAIINRDQYRAAMSAIYG